MKKLDKFVLKSFVGPLVFTFFIVLIILLLQFLWMYVDELAGKGLELNILGELLFQFSLSFIPTALPLAILLAALMTFGNMGEFSELTALKSSGIPLQRIMRPLMVLIGLLVIVSFLFSNYVLPYSNRQARLLLYDIRKKRPDINLQAGSFNNDIDGFSIRITGKDPLTNRLDKLYIYDHRSRRGNVSVTYADSGYIKVTPDESAMIMILYNGYSFTELEERPADMEERRNPTRKDSFKEQKMVMSLSGFDLERSGNEMFKSTSWMLNMEQLDHFIDSLSTEYYGRNNAYFNEYMATNIFVERLINPARINNHDSINVIPENRFSVGKIFDTLSFNMKRNTLVKSIDYIRDANVFIGMNKDMMKVLNRQAQKYVIDWHKKLTLPFACMVFFFIGAPLGAIIRKGGLGTPAVISIFLFVVWYVISLTGEKLVEESKLGSIAGMWASSYILFPIGLFLTYKATTDSVIMNTETYLIFFRKVKGIIGQMANWKKK